MNQSFHYTFAGLSVVLSYKYLYNPETDIVRASDDNQDDKTRELGMTELSIIHLACIFDQDQVIEFLAMYGLNNIHQW